MLKVYFNKMQTKICCELASWVGLAITEEEPLIWCICHECLKVYFNKIMQRFAASLQVGLTITEKEPLIWCICHEKILQLTLFIHFSTGSAAGFHTTLHNLYCRVCALYVLRYLTIRMLSLCCIERTFNTI